MRIMLKMCYKYNIIISISKNLQCGGRKNYYYYYYYSYYYYY